MKIGSHKQTLFAQGSALGWELFGPRGADAQGVALGLSQSFSLLLDDAPAPQMAALSCAKVSSGRLPWGAKHRSLASSPRNMPCRLRGRSQCRHDFWLRISEAPLSPTNPTYHSSRLAPVSREVQSPGTRSRWGACHRRSSSLASGCPQMRAGSIRPRCQFHGTFRSPQRIVE